LEKEFILIIDLETIQARVGELAGQISSDYEGMEPVLVGILNGVVFFFSDLVMGLTIPSRIDFIRAESYGSATSSSGSVRFTKDVEIAIQGKPVILVEDIVDTGLTITKIIDRLREKEPESVKICALIDKTERRESEVPITYSGFQVNEGFLIGYGLDYDEQFRYLPGIYALG